MGNLWPIALSADLTPLCQVIADILQSGHKGVCKLAEAFFGRVVNEKLRSSLLTAAQNEAADRIMAVLPEDAGITREQIIQLLLISVMQEIMIVQ